MIEDENEDGIFDFYDHNEIWWVKVFPNKAEGRKEADFYIKASDANLLRKTLKGFGIEKGFKFYPGQYLYDRKQIKSLQLGDFVDGIVE